MEQETISKKKEIVRLFLEQKALLSSGFLEEIKNLGVDEIKETILTNLDNNILFLNRDTHGAIGTASNKVNWAEVERSRVIFEKKGNKQPYSSVLNSIEESNEKEKEGPSDVKVLFSYVDEPKKRNIQDFVSFFNARYREMAGMLEKRHELSGASSINRILGKKERGQVSVIGLVIEKHNTKNGNILLTLEDPTGTIRAVVSKNKADAFNIAKDIILDEVIGISGSNGENIIFANTVVLPGIPLNKEMKKSPDEVYAAFLSDLHVGSNNFLPDEFNKFIKWIRLESGNEIQQAIASKIKYVFIAGDIVDGVGIYPRQNEELTIPDIYDQYAECARLLGQIPSHINIIICPGNHDAVRLSEPQPPFCKDFAKPLWELPNLTLVSNPSVVNIHSQEGFPGFNVLLYHGYGFDYYIANVDTIRSGGGYDRADLIMSFLLERRHLAPTHKSTLYIPDQTRDPLIMGQIPDFFVTGHIHKSAVANYKNITMICGSCWQSKTSFQEKVGHHPDPAKVPVVNLQTRQIKILNFSK